jgi:hypothetical protein
VQTIFAGVVVELNPPNSAGMAVDSLPMITLSVVTGRKGFGFWNEAVG